MNHIELLNNYAELIVKHGLNVQPGQLVNLNMEIVHRELGLLLTEHSYKAGAKYVNLHFSDVKVGKARFTHSQPQYLDFVGNDQTAKYDQVLSERGANLSIVGSEDPHILEDVNPAHIQTTRLARYNAIKPFYEEGIGKSKVHWTVAAAATEKWGKQVFPKLSEKEALHALWDQIFKLCRVDRPDFLKVWKDHNRTLQERASKLTELAIKSLVFTGPGTDLEVFLSKQALWKGGAEMGPHGVEFEPNLPTEECFTTPDCNKTNGRVRVTRPVQVNGVFVRDLELEFADGELVNFTATSGLETLKAYLSSDVGAKKLGEVALVGIDSPVFKSGLVFSEILFDENAACHIALGSAYKFCLKGGEGLNNETLSELGCNDSSVHTDFMISSEQVDVHAKLFNGSTVQLIKSGSWCE